MRLHHIALPLAHTDEPFLALLASGGHCQLLWIRGVGDISVLGGTLDDALGEYACEEDAEAVADRERHFISESTDERLKAAIKKKVGLEPGANRFHALVDEMNLTHVTKKPKDIFDWKEEVKFMFCGVDVDEVAAILHSFGKPMTEAEVSCPCAWPLDCHAVVLDMGARGGRCSTW